MQVDRPTAMRPAQRPMDRRTWPQRILLTLGCLGTAACLFIAGAIYFVSDSLDEITEIPLALGGSGGGENPDDPTLREPENWLLVGTDSRDGIDETDPNAGFLIGEPVFGKRTDTMIIARVDPSGQAIDLLSIPRDLYVPIAGTGRSDRINSAFNAEDGAQRLVDTIQQSLDIELDHYIEVNFVGFRDVIDAIGGVPIWFDTPMRDAGSGLNIETAGCFTLDGADSLAFARARSLEIFSNGSWSTDPSADLGRISRQQYFLQRVADRAVSSLDITSLATIDDIVEAGSSNLSIDQGGFDDLVELARIFRNYDTDRIIGHTLATEQARIDDKAVLRLVESESIEVLDLFRGRLAPPTTTTTVPDVQELVVPAPGEFELTVLNGSGVPGQAGEAAAIFEDLGYLVARVGDARTGEDITTVRYAEGDLGAAQLVAGHVVGQVQLLLDPTVTGRIVITTGINYTDLRTESDVDAIETAPTTTAPPPPAVAPSETVGVVPGPSPIGTACG